MQKQLITSLLDVDAYKDTMELVSWLHHRSLPVRWSFTNRSNEKYPLVDLVDRKELVRQLEMTRELTYTESEIDFKTSYFSRFHPAFASLPYRYYLKNFRLPPITVREEGKTYRIEPEGLNPETSRWETLVLRIVACLAGQRLANHIYGVGGEYTAWQEGIRRLREKTWRLLDYPDLHLVEFGTRRAFSPSWHASVLEYLLGELAPGQLLGTSNVGLAKRFGIDAKGTMAHQELMIEAAWVDGMGGSDADIRRSHMDVFDRWERVFSPFSGDALLTALTDTFGLDSFLADFGPERARRWKMLRDDSGDADVSTEKILAFYERHRIDPKTKGRFFADGETIDTMIPRHVRYRERIPHPFGPGTHLSNDMGLPTLSLVMKADAVFVNGIWVPTVKLTNNVQKAHGPKEKVERYKRIFGHTSDFSEECRY